MKALFYYSFGIITILFALIMLFHSFASEFIDDYWLTIIYHEYFNVMNIITIAITAIFFFYLFVWVYNLTEKPKDKLIIKNNEEEIKPYL